MKLKQSTKDTLNRLWAEAEKRASAPEVIPDTMPEGCYIRPVKGGQDANCDYVRFDGNHYVGHNFGLLKDLTPYEWSVNLRVWKPCV